MTVSTRKTIFRHHPYLLPIMSFHFGPNFFDSIYPSNIYSKIFRHCFIKKKHFCLEGLISCFVTVCGIILLIMICIIRIFSQKSKRNSRCPSSGPNAGPVRKDSKMKESSSNVFVQLNKSKDIRKFQKNLCWKIL